MRYLVAVLFTAILAGCGGARMLKTPLPIPPSGALASATDEHVECQLQWVIVRDGPGAWARNVDWDEYLLLVRNVSEHGITVIGVAVYDSLGTRVESSTLRNQLVAESRSTAGRYREHGLKIEAGMGASTLLATGAASYLAGSALGIAVLSGSAGVSAAGVAIGAIVAGPAIAAGGVVRAVNNRRVSREIELRSTSLPVTVPPEHTGRLDLFFPLTPEPRRIELSYATDEGRSKVLTIEPLAALRGLHLQPDSP